jgi:colanic acid biosynthesis glycosyl transferase WcaI
MHGIRNINGKPREDSIKPGKLMMTSVRKTSSKDILFLNRYFSPDHSATSQILADVAFDLANRGQNVTVITSRQRYNDANAGLSARETIAGVNVVRVWTTRFGRDRLVGRVLDYLTFYVAATLAVWQLARSGDTIVAKTDPPMLGVIVGPVARMRGAKLVNWLQDVFPEVLEELGVGASRLTKFAFVIMRALRNHSLARAAMNIALGTRMAERLTALGIDKSQIAILPNWADDQLIRPINHADNPLREAWGLNGTFVVAYSGNFGRAHEIETLLTAMQVVNATQIRSGAALKPVCWVFIGGGVAFELLRTASKLRGLPGVKFFPYQPREKLAYSLSVADIHLISLRPELEGLIVPSKFYGIAAAGRPTLFIGDEDGEIGRLLQVHGCGVSVAQGNSELLAGTVLSLAADQDRCRKMGGRAREAIDKHYSKALAMVRWTELLQNVQKTDRQVVLNRT